MTPAAFFEKTVMSHEGKLSLDPKDRGNWHRGKLVGSKYGVTGDVLAEYRKVKSISAADMAALSTREAIDVGLSMYYYVRGISRLPWDRVIASVVDFGYNAGVERAVKKFQTMLKVNPDGWIGDATINAYRKWLDLHGEDKADDLWSDVRIDYYRSLNNAKYINGWTNRAKSFLSSTAWWKLW